MREERKHKKVETTDLLNFIAKDIPYSNDKNRDKQQDFKNELEEREPFRDMKHKIDRMSKQIRDLEEMVSMHSCHKHDEQGNVVIPIEKTSNRRMF